MEKLEGEKPKKEKKNMKANLINDMDASDQLPDKNRKEFESQQDIGGGEGLQKKSSNGYKKAKFNHLSPDSIEKENRNTNEDESFPDKFVQPF